MMISNAEFYFWVVMGMVGLVAMIACFLPWNPYYNAKAKNDPYYYFDNRD